MLSISPFAPGNNNFKISFLDSSRHPIDIKSVQLKLTEIEKGIGPIKVDTRQISKGVFSANAAFGLLGSGIFRSKVSKVSQIHQILLQYMQI